MIETKWPADISLFINDDGPPVDIWHDGVCGGPMLTANSMDAAQAIVGAIEELHGLRGDNERLRTERDEAVHARDFTHRWYATRLHTIKDWAREHGHLDLIASIIANDGSPPTFARMLATEKHRADRAEQERDATRAEVADLRDRNLDYQQALHLAEQDRDNLAAASTATIAALQMQITDLQLALASERLDPTAGKDLGYELHSGVYTRDVEGGHIEVELYDDKRGRWRAYRFARGLVVPPWREVWADNARTAMREANEKEKP